MKLSIIVLFILSFVFVGCDKGAKPIGKAESEYDAMVKDGLSMKHADAIGPVYIMAGIIAKAHPNEGSGKRALKLRERIQKDVMDMIQKEKPELDALGEKFVAAMKEADTEAVKINKEVLKTKHDVLRGEKFKDGDCTFRTETKEFTGGPILFDVQAYRAEKVGKENVMKKPYFVAKRGEFNKEFKKTMDDTPATEESIAMFSLGRKIKCERVDKLRDLYEAASAIGTDFNPRMQAVQSLAGMINSAAH